MNWWTFPLKIERNASGARVKKSWKSSQYSAGARWGQSCDPAVIRKDCRDFPEAGVGIATGLKSKIFVVEVDTQTGHGVDGPAALRTLEEQHGALPETLMAESPSGSIHRYYRLPEDLPEGLTIRNSTGAIAPGIDVRGEGGMVAAPPTKRDDGAYGWLNWGLPVASAPDWLIALCLEANATTRRTKTSQPERPERPEPRPRATPSYAEYGTLPPPSDAEMRALPAAIDNPAGLTWHEWNTVGMAFWAATNGSGFGFALFDEWSRKWPGYQDGISTEATRTKWEDYATSPPSSVKVNTLLWMANRDSPGWRQPFRDPPKPKPPTPDPEPPPIPEPESEENPEELPEPDDPDHPDAQDPESDPDPDLELEEDSEEESEEQPDQPEPEPDPEPQAFNPDALIDAAVDDNTVVYKPDVLAALAQLYRDDRVAYERLLDDLKAEARIGKTALNKAVLALVREHIKAEPPPPPPPPPEPKDLPQGALVLDPQHPLANARKLVGKHFSHPNGQTLYEYRGAFYRWSGAAFLQIKPKAIRSKLWHLLDESFEAQPEDGLVHAVQAHQPPRLRGSRCPLGRGLPRRRDRCAGLDRPASPLRRTAAAGTARLQERRPAPAERSPAAAVAGPVQRQCHRYRLRPEGAQARGLAQIPRSGLRRSGDRGRHRYRGHPVPAGIRRLYPRARHLAAEDSVYGRPAAQRQGHHRRCLPPLRRQNQCRSPDFVIPDPRIRPRTPDRQDPGDHRRRPHGPAHGAELHPRNPALDLRRGFPDRAAQIPGSLARHAAGPLHHDVERIAPFR